MTFALISTLATLSLLLALNWNNFQRMGWGNVARMLLIWGVIITGLALALRLFGF
jgi:hypothetical protein